MLKKQISKLLIFSLIVTSLFPTNIFSKESNSNVTKVMSDNYTIKEKNSNLQNTNPLNEMHENSVITSNNTGQSSTEQTTYINSNSTDSSDTYETASENTYLVKPLLKKYIINYSSQKSKVGFQNKKQKFKDKKKNLKIKKDLRNFPKQIVELTESEAQDLRSNPEIASIEPDNIMSVLGDTYTYTTEVTTWGYDTLNFDSIHNQGALGDGIKIAIIDTGIDFTHPDLNITNGQSFIHNSYQDDQGHGTQVAGIIASKINNIGVKGIAPNSQIYSLKVFDQNGQGSYSDIISAIDWAIDNHINIINMSFGGSDNSQALQDAIKAAWDAGILIVAAAGNDGMQTIQFPAAYATTIAVGSIKNDLSLSNFSNYGENLELVAPGENIFTTDIGESYKLVNGTSFSSAYVTGSASVIWSAHPDWSALQVRQAMLNSSASLGDKTHFGYGLINPTQAIDQQFQREIIVDATGVFGKLKMLNMAAKSA